jgi:hypothetical protein
MNIRDVPRWLALRVLLWFLLRKFMQQLLRKNDGESPNYIVFTTILLIWVVSRVFPGEFSPARWEYEKRFGEPGVPRSPRRLSGM